MLAIPVAVVAENVAKVAPATDDRGECEITLVGGTKVAVAHTCADVVDRLRRA